MHYRDRGYRQPLHGLHQGEDAGHEDCALGRAQTLELVHVHTCAEHLAPGPEQHRSRPAGVRGDGLTRQRGFPRGRPPRPALRDDLVERVFQIGGELAVEQVERGPVPKGSPQLGHVTRSVSRTPCCACRYFLFPRSSHRLAGPGGEPRPVRHNDLPGRSSRGRVRQSSGHADTYYYVVLSTLVTIPRTRPGSPEPNARKGAARGRRWSRGRSSRGGHRALRSAGGSSRQTSLQDIADATGLTRPALYHYFSSKEDLLSRLVSAATEGPTADEPRGIRGLPGGRPERRTPARDGIVDRACCRRGASGSLPAADQIRGGPSCRPGQDVRQRPAPCSPRGHGAHRGGRQVGRVPRGRTAHRGARDHRFCATG